MKTKTSIQSRSCKSRAWLHGSDERNAAGQSSPLASSRRVLLNRIVRGAALLGLGTAAFRKSAAADVYSNVAYTGWVHGNSIIMGDPFNHPITRLGFSGTVAVPPNSWSTVLFAIPTPVIFNGRRLRIDRVLLNFRLPSLCSINNLGISDGGILIAWHNPGMSGERRFADFIVPGAPAVWRGIGLKLDVCNRSAVQQPCEFFSAGADFIY